MTPSITDEHDNAFCIAIYLLHELHLSTTLIGITLIDALEVVSTSEAPFENGVEKTYQRIDPQNDILTGTSEMKESAKEVQGHLKG